MKSKTHIRVITPATSANLGPGFDSLGLALDLTNEIEAVVTDGADVTLTIEGEGADELPADETNVIVSAMRRAAEAVGQPLPGLRIACRNQIPLGAGLGSSAAALVGGLAAGNALTGGRLSPDDLLRLATELEGHADNVSACLLGGLTVASAGTFGVVARRVAVAPLMVVVVLPAMQMSTREQRAALPRMVPLSDAAANIGRAALVVQALGAGDFDLLAAAMCDHLHVPYRQRMIPGYEAVGDAARAAGAAAVTISGAGPSLAAFAPAGHDRIAAAMIAAFERAGGVSARAWTLPVASAGVRVEESRL